MKRIIDCETGEITERELNVKEIEQEKKDNAAFKAIENARLNDEAEKLAKKAELLSKLGISEEEAKLLLS